MKPWGQCRERFHAIETQKLQRLLTRHAETCHHERDCPLNALESVMARSLAGLSPDRPEIIPWPTAKR